MYMYFTYMFVALRRNTPRGAPMVGLCWYLWCRCCLVTRAERPINVRCSPRHPLSTGPLGEAFKFQAMLVNASGERLDAQRHSETKFVGVLCELAEGELIVMLDTHVSRSCSCTSERLLSISGLVFNSTRALLEKKCMLNLHTPEPRNCETCGNSA